MEGVVRGGAVPPLLLFVVAMVGMVAMVESVAMESAGPGMCLGASDKNLNFHAKHGLTAPECKLLAEETQHSLGATYYPEKKICMVHNEPGVLLQYPYPSGKWDEDSTIDGVLDGGAVKIRIEINDVDSSKFSDAVNSLHRAVVDKTSNLYNAYGVRSLNAELSTRTSHKGTVEWVDPCTPHKDLDPAHAALQRVIVKDLGECKGVCALVPNCAAVSFHEVTDIGSPMCNVFLKVDGWVDVPPSSKAQVCQTVAPAQPPPVTELSISLSIPLSLTDFKAHRQQLIDAIAGVLGVDPKTIEITEKAGSTSSRFHSLEHSTLDLRIGIASTVKDSSPEVLQKHALSAFLGSRLHRPQGFRCKTGVTFPEDDVHLIASIPIQHSPKHCISLCTDVPTCKRVSYSMDQCSLFESRATFIPSTQQHEVACIREDDKASVAPPTGFKCRVTSHALVGGLVAKLHDIANLERCKSMCSHTNGVCDMVAFSAERSECLLLRGGEVVQMQDDQSIEYEVCTTKDDEADGAPTLPGHYTHFVHTRGSLGDDSTILSTVENVKTAEECTTFCARVAPCVVAVFKDGECVMRGEAHDSPNGAQEYFRRGYECTGYAAPVKDDPFITFEEVPSYTTCIDYCTSTSTCRYAEWTESTCNLFTAIPVTAGSDAAPTPKVLGCKRVAVDETPAPVDYTCLQASTFTGDFIMALENIADPTECMASCSKLPNCAAIVFAKGSCEFHSGFAGNAVGEVVEGPSDQTVCTPKGNDKYVCESGKGLSGGHLVVIEQVESMKACTTACSTIATCYGAVYKNKECQLKSASARVVAADEAEACLRKQDQRGFLCNPGSFSGGDFEYSIENVQTLTACTEFCRRQAGCYVVTLVNNVCWVRGRGAVVSEGTGGTSCISTSFSEDAPAVVPAPTTPDQPFPYFTCHSDTAMPDDSTLLVLSATSLEECHDFCMKVFHECAAFSFADGSCSLHNSTTDTRAGTGTACTKTADASRGAVETDSDSPTLAFHCVGGDALRVHPKHLELCSAGCQLQKGCHEFTVAKDGKCSFQVGRSLRGVECRLGGLGGEGSAEGSYFQPVLSTHTFVGGDFAVITGVQTASECEAKCAEYPSCTVIVHSPHGTCLLKSAGATQVATRLLNITDGLYSAAKMNELDTTEDAVDCSGKVPYVGGDLYSEEVKDIDGCEGLCRKVRQCKVAAFDGARCHLKDWTATPVGEKSSMAYCVKEVRAMAGRADGGYQCSTGKVAKGAEEVGSHPDTSMEDCAALCTLHGECNAVRHPGCTLLKIEGIENGDQAGYLCHRRARVEEVETKSPETTLRCSGKDYHEGGEVFTLEDITFATCQSQCHRLASDQCQHIRYVEKTRTCVLMSNEATPGRHPGAGVVGCTRQRRAAHVLEAPTVEQGSGEIVPLPFTKLCLGLYIPSLDTNAFTHDGVLPVPSAPKLPLHLCMLIQTPPGYDAFDYGKSLPSIFTDELAKSGPNPLHAHLNNLLEERGLDMINKDNVVVLPVGEGGERSETMWLSTSVDEQSILRVETTLPPDHYDSPSSRFQWLGHLAEALGVSLWSLHIRSIDFCVLGKCSTIWTPAEANTNSTNGTASTTPSRRMRALGGTGETNIDVVVSPQGGKPPSCEEVQKLLSKSANWQTLQKCSSASKKGGKGTTDGGGYKGGDGSGSVSGSEDHAPADEGEVTATRVVDYKKSGVRGGHVLEVQGRGGEVAGESEKVGVCSEGVCGAGEGVTCSVDAKNSTKRICGCAEDYICIEGCDLADDTPRRCSKATLPREFLRACAGILQFPPTAFTYASIFDSNPDTKGITLQDFLVRRESTHSLLWHFEGLTVDEFLLPNAEGATPLDAMRKELEEQTGVRLGVDTFSPLICSVTKGTKKTVACYGPEGNPRQVSLPPVVGMTQGTWSESEAFCTSHGQKLAKISSAAQLQQYIEQAEGALQQGLTYWTDIKCPATDATCDSYASFRHSDGSTANLKELMGGEALEGHNKHCVFLRQNREGRWVAVVEYCHAKHLPACMPDSSESLENEEEQCEASQGCDLKVSFKLSIPHHHTVVYVTANGITLPYSATRPLPPNTVVKMVDGTVVGRTDGKGRMLSAKVEELLKIRDKPLGDKLRSWMTQTGAPRISVALQAAVEAGLGTLAKSGGLGKDAFSHEVCHKWERMQRVTCEDSTCVAKDSDLIAGTNCQGYLACTPEYCKGHGAVAGYEGECTCKCFAGFAGDDCSHCAAGYMDYPHCRKAPTGTGGGTGGGDKPGSSKDQYIQVFHVLVGAPISVVGLDGLQKFIDATRSLYSTDVVAEVNVHYVCRASACIPECPQKIVDVWDSRFRSSCLKTSTAIYAPLLPTIADSDLLLETTIIGGTLTSSESSVVEMIVIGDYSIASKTKLEVAAMFSGPLNARIGDNSAPWRDMPILHVQPVLGPIYAHEFAVPDTPAPTVEPATDARSADDLTSSNSKVNWLILLVVGGVLFVCIIVLSAILIYRKRKAKQKGLMAKKLEDPGFLYRRGSVNDPFSDEGNEVVVMYKEKSQPTGMHLSDNTRLADVYGGPAAECGMSKFIGRRILRVNGTEVFKLHDIQELVEGKTVIKFEFEPAPAPLCLKIAMGIESFDSAEFADIFADLIDIDASLVDVIDVVETADGILVVAILNNLTRAEIQDIATRCMEDDDPLRTDLLIQQAYLHSGQAMSAYEKRDLYPEELHVALQWHDQYSHCAGRYQQISANVHGHPVWMNDAQDRFLFSTVNGYWAIVGSQSAYSKEDGFLVVSVHKHRGLPPHVMTAWKVGGTKDTDVCVSEAERMVFGFKLGEWVRLCNDISEDGVRKASGATGLVRGGRGSRVKVHFLDGSDTIGFVSPHDLDSAAGPRVSALLRGEWRSAQIVNANGNMLKVAYDGMDARNHEWIDKDSDRLDFADLCHMGIGDIVCLTDTAEPNDCLSPGETGKIVRYCGDGSLKPFQVLGPKGTTKWFRVDEVALAECCITIGSKVVLAEGVDHLGSIRPGEVGEVTRFCGNESPEPIQVRGPRGTTAWYRMDELVVAESAPHRPHEPYGRAMQGDNDTDPSDIDVSSSISQRNGQSSRRISTA